MLLISVTILTAPIKANAQDPYVWSPTCVETLSACDKALRDQIKVTDLQAAIISEMERRHTMLDKQNDELRGQVGAWYRNPLVVGGIGIGLGALLMGVIKK